MVKAMPVVDVIFLSYAKNDYLRSLTQQAIDSLLASEDSELVQFKVLVIESNRDLSPYQYHRARTIYPEPPFGFHRYLNIGIRMTNSPFVCLCNNDLIFEKRWASEILKAMHDDPLLLSASPYCPRFHQQAGFARDAIPLPGHVAGWCIFVKREIFDKIGELDERFEFWYADWDYLKTLENSGIKHCLISSSFVTHLRNESLNTLDIKATQRLTTEQRLYFEYKWLHKSKVRYLFSILVFSVKSLLRRLVRRND